MAINNRVKVANDVELKDRLVAINRVTKVTKGGAPALQGLSLKKEKERERTTWGDQASVGKAHTLFSKVVFIP